MRDRITGTDTDRDAFHTVTPVRVSLSCPIVQWHAHRALNVDSTGSSRSVCGGQARTGHGLCGQPHRDVRSCPRCCRGGCPHAVDHRRAGGLTTVTCRVSRGSCWPMSSCGGGLADRPMEVWPAAATAEAIPDCFLMAAFDSTLRVVTPPVGIFHTAPKRLHTHAHPGAADSTATRPGRVPWRPRNTAQEPSCPPTLTR